MNLKFIWLGIIGLLLIFQLPSCKGKNKDADISAAIQSKTQTDANLAGDTLPLSPPTQGEGDQTEQKRTKKKKSNRDPNHIVDREVPSVAVVRRNIDSANAHAGK